MQRRSKKALRHISAVLSLSLMVHATPVMSYDTDYRETPSAGYMLADAVFARPLMAVGTVAGLGAFVVSLPFSLLGGNVGEAANQLVLKPAAHTFLRCLGCKHYENKWFQPDMDHDTADAIAEGSMPSATMDMVQVEEAPVYDAEMTSQQQFEDAVEKEAAEI